MEEGKWKNIKEFENYKVSYDGEIMGPSGKILKTFNQHGKIITTLKKNKQKYSRQVHYLVALMFVENPNNYKNVKVIDGDYKNINYHNLQWVNFEYDTTAAWEPLKSYSKYEICKIGIRNATSLRLLTPQITASGYSILHLTDDKGKLKLCYIHVLMATQYLPNPNNLPQVNHLDGNKKNFNVENLEWVTLSDNILHAYETGLISKKGSKQKTFVVYESLSDEIWRNVNVCNQEINVYYEVSSHGRVRNKKRGKLLTPDIINNYHRVTLLGINFCVHRLVAFSFLENKGKESDKKLHVNHKDKIHDHNHFNNLEILNVKDHMRKDHGRPLLALNKNLEYSIFQSGKEAGEVIGIDNSGIQKAIDRNGTCGGHRWFYLNTPEADNIIELYKEKGN